MILLHRQAATKLDGLNTTQMQSAREDGCVYQAVSLCSALLPTVSCDVQSVQAQAVAWDAWWDIEAGDPVHLGRLSSGRPFRSPEHEKKRRATRESSECARKNKATSWTCEIDEPHSVSSL